MTREYVRIRQGVKGPAGRVFEVSYRTEGGAVLLIPHRVYNYAEQRFFRDDEIEPHPGPRRRAKRGA